MVAASLPLLLLVLPAQSAAGDDLAVLRRAHLPPTGKELLAFFSRRSAPGPAREAILPLIRKLSADDPGERDEAAGQLISLGHASVPFLRRAANDPDDTQLRARAQTCVNFIQGPEAADLVLRALRIVARDRPEGAVPVLLAYLPFADNEEVVAAVEEALVAGAVSDGKPHPALLEALKDPSPVRRASAARALCRAAGAGAHEHVRSLLADSSPSVALRAAYALADAHDGRGVTTIINLLDRLPPAASREAEEYLERLAGAWAVQGPAGDGPLTRRLRRAVWKGWWEELNGKRLLAEFRARTLPDAEREKVERLIAGLGAPSSEERREAAAGILALGGKVAPLLVRAAGREDSSDEKARLIAGEAGRLLKALGPDVPEPLPPAAIRLLALRRPAGTLEALLAHVPFAADEKTDRQIVEVLAALGCPAGRAEPALVKGLEDGDPDRRIAAARALCRGRAVTNFPDVRKLFADPDTQVRLQAALALAHARDKEAVPALIDLLGKLPLDKVWEVEDYLVGVAGEDAPSLSISGDADRPRSVAAWKAWWATHGEKLDVARLEPRDEGLGELIVVESYNPATRTGRILGLGLGGKVRWEIGGLRQPLDVAFGPSGRLFLLEQNRLSARDRKGKILWSLAVPNAFACERLRDGNLFVACREQPLVVDPSGKVLSTHRYVGNPILAARWLPGGDVALVDYGGQYVRLGAKGGRLASARLPFAGRPVGGAEVLPGGRVLVSLRDRPTRVCEYTLKGELVWQAEVSNPGIPHRLRNGHTLVVSHGNTALTEIDRKGKVVSTRTGLPFRPTRAFRR